MGDAHEEGRSGIAAVIVLQAALAAILIGPAGPVQSAPAGRDVRAGAYRLSPSGTEAASGIDQVYGVNVSRLLADEDEPDELTLGLNGTLAAAMASGTYVTGESASIAPLGADPGRSMYLPPNSGGNTALLETLRVMLVHGDAEPGRCVPRPRACVRDAAGLARRRQEHRRCERPDELRARRLLDPAGRRRDPRHGRRRPRPPTGCACACGSRAAIAWWGSRSRATRFRSIQ